MSIHQFTSACLFYDTQNYPHGFSRSGEYSTAESERLTLCGHTIRQLTTRMVSPQNKAQQRLVDVIEGKKSAESEVEKTWLKYLNAVSQKKMLFTCSFRPLTAGSHNRIDTPLADRTRDC